ncbi:hypothetical protein Tco_1217851 [Tanacetum coccineum]
MNGNNLKRCWKPISKPVANSKPQWKPTGRHFSLFEKHPLTRIMESTDQPIDLPPRFQRDLCSTNCFYGIWTLDAHDIHDRGDCASSYQLCRKSSLVTVKIWERWNMQAIIVLIGDYNWVGHISSLESICEDLKPTYSQYDVLVMELGKAESITSLKTAKTTTTENGPLSKDGTELLWEAARYYAHSLRKAPTVLYGLKCGMAAVWPRTSTNDFCAKQYRTRTSALQSGHVSVLHSSPSTTVISEGAPAVTESLLPHQIPLPDTSDSDVETLFDHVDSNVFDTMMAPDEKPVQMQSFINSVNIVLLREQPITSCAKGDSSTSA